MGACVSTAANADVTKHQTNKPTKKQTKSSSSFRGRSLSSSSSPETRFSRDGSSSSSPCNSDSPGSPSPSIARQRLAPLEADFKKPVKRSLSSSFLLQVRSLTNSPEHSSLPVVRRKVRRARSLCTTDSHVAGNAGIGEGPKPERRRSVGDIPASVKQDFLQILKGKEGEEDGAKIEGACEDSVKTSIRVDETAGSAVTPGRQEEETVTEKNGSCQENSGSNSIGEAAPVTESNGNLASTHIVNGDSLDVEQVINVDWHYPILEDKAAFRVYTNHTNSLEPVQLDALKRETIHNVVQERKRQEVNDKDEIVDTVQGSIGWPLLAGTRANVTKSSKSEQDITASSSQPSDADQSKNEVSVAVSKRAPESFLDVKNVEKIPTAKMMENLSVEMEAFLEDVRKTSSRNASLSVTENSLDQKRSQTEMLSGSLTATTGKSIPVSPKASPRKPASPKASKPPKPKPSNFLTGKGKTNPMDKFFIGTSLFDLSAFIDEENDLEKDENEDVAEFDPALLATFEEAFQQYSKEDWMNASRDDSPRRRSLEVWAKAVAKAASLKEEKQTNESGSWDGAAIGENSFSPTSVLSSTSSFASNSSWDSNHSPKQIVSRDVWASEGEVEVTSELRESNSNKGVEVESVVKEKSGMHVMEHTRLSDSPAIDIAAVFDRFLSVHPESTNMAFFDSSESKSPVSTAITA